MKRHILLLAAVALLSVVFCSAGFYWFEAGRQPSVRGLGDVLWWWAVTAATVGYGDIVPQTAGGRWVAVVAMISGVFIYTNFVAMTAEWAHHFLERRIRGEAQVTSRDHILICEYTAIADELIQSIPECPELASREVVIISDLVLRNPYRQHQFVFGVPINPASLRRANVGAAKYVFVFANLRFADPDVKTLHVASRVLHLNPGAMVFVELLNPDSELLGYLRGQVIPMASRQLVESVLRLEKIDPFVWKRRFDERRGGAA